MELLHKETVTVTRETYSYKTKEEMYQHAKEMNIHGYEEVSKTVYKNGIRVVYELTE